MDISKIIKDLGLFGSNNPKEMPPHYFSGAIYIDYKTALRANVAKQDFSVSPRHWYIDCDFHCSKCRQEFTWTAREQKAWFEIFRFWVDAMPRMCKRCKSKARDLINLRKEYDAKIGAARNKGTIDQKKRIMAIVQELQFSLSNLPQRMLDTAKLFDQQTRRLASEASPADVDSD